MPRLLEAKKDVVSCEKLAGICKRELIREFLNGTTRQAEGLTHSNDGLTL